MTTEAEIKAAFAQGEAAASPATAAVFKQMGREWRSEQAKATDIDDAFAVVAAVESDPSTVDAKTWRLAMVRLIQGAAALPDKGTNSAEQFSASLRAIMVNETAPTWLADECQRWARTIPLSMDKATGKRVVYQDPADPIESKLAEALAEISSGGSSAEALKAAIEVVSKYKELSPSALASSSALSAEAIKNP